MNKQCIQYGMVNYKYLKKYNTYSRLFSCEIIRVCIMVPIELPSSTLFFNLSIEIDNFEENILWYYENKILISIICIFCPCKSKD